MALVVLLRGVNVGGHRTFRPAVLAQRLKHLDAVNIGAAGTFVIRRPVAAPKVGLPVTQDAAAQSVAATVPSLTANGGESERERV